MIEYELFDVTVRSRRIKSASCSWCGKLFSEELIKCERFGKVTVDFLNIRFSGEICDKCFTKHLKKHMKKDLNG